MSQPDNPAAFQVLKNHPAEVPEDWVQTLEHGLPTSAEERAMVFGTALHALHPDTTRAART
ncbi:hypothetical protein [Streptomyces sp. NPDC048309]|uniref:hypothetical protein n=1 Tax=unclassified Streptomyces TaxID=2593676 RepID=UPI0033F58E81